MGELASLAGDEMAVEDLRGRPATRTVWAIEAARDEGHTTWITSGGERVAAIVPAAAVRPVGRDARAIRLTAAATHLAAAGYDVLERDWRCTDGTLDVAAGAPGGRVLAVCKVTSAPEPVLTRRELRQLQRVAMRWLTARGVLFDEVRVDLISVRDGTVTRHQEGVPA